MVGRAADRPRGRAVPLAPRHVPTRGSGGGTPPALRGLHPGPGLPGTVRAGDALPTSGRQLRPGPAEPVRPGTAPGPLHRTPGAPFRRRFGVAHRLLRRICRPGSQAKRAPCPDERPGQRQTGRVADQPRLLPPQDFRPGQSHRHPGRRQGPGQFPQFRPQGHSCRLPRIGGCFVTRLRPHPGLTPKERRHVRQRKGSQVQILSVPHDPRRQDEILPGFHVHDVAGGRQRRRLLRPGREDRKQLRPDPLKPGGFFFFPGRC